MKFTYEFYGQLEIDRFFTNADLEEIMQLYLSIKINAGSERLSRFNTAEKQISLEVKNNGTD